MQKSLSCSTASFIYFHSLSFHTVLWSKVHKSFQILLLRPSGLLNIISKAFNIPRQFKIKPTSGVTILTQLSDSTAKHCFSQKPGTQLGAWPSGFAVTRDGCSVKRVTQSQPFASRSTAAANILWHPQANIPWWFNVNISVERGSEEKLSPGHADVGAAVSP